MGCGGRGGTFPPPDVCCALRIESQGEEMRRDEMRVHVSSIIFSFACRHKLHARSNDIHFNIKGVGL